MLAFVTTIILVKVHICIKDFKVLKIWIVLLFISKNKLLIKLLLNWEEKNAIINIKLKNNDGILLLRVKKMFLLNNSILANKLVTYKKL